MSRARISRCRALSRVVGISLVSLSMLSPAVGAQEPEPWEPETVGLLRSFFERTDVEEVLEGLRRPSPGDPPRSIEAVAARLPPEIEAPLEFVRGLRHLSYAGSVLGPAGALRAGAGNALDRSALLARLYRLQGSRARLVRGRLRWADAVRLVGEEPERLSPGDPWLRRVELAADHWWVEVLGPEDGWTEVDPAFPAGVPGVRREVHEVRPPALVAMARVRLLAGDTELARHELEAGELVGGGVELSLGAAVPEDRALSVPADDASTASGEAGRPVGAAESGSAPELESEPEADREPDELDRLLERLRSDELVGDLLVAGRGEAVGIRAGVEDLRLEIRIQAPHAMPLVADVAVQARPGSGVAVVVESGPVTDRLAREALPVFDLLRALGSAERAALEAFEARPRPEEEGGPEPRDGDTSGGVMPAPEVPPLADDEEEPGDPPPMHPARRLHLASLRAWQELDRALPTAAGTAVLAAVDRMHRGLAAEPSPLRVAIVRLSPPTPDAAGSLTLWSSDGVRFRSLDGPARQGVRAGFGFLRSAVLGQVLHRVADAAPLTAFDLTLRSVGRGTRLSWWEGEAGLPGSWPQAALELARVDLIRGYTIVGPGDPVREEEPVLGWWAIDRASGGTEGRVLRGSVLAEAMVDFGPPLEPAEPAAVLASLPSLHQAARWLILAGISESGAMEPLLPGACAATSLVGDLVAAGAPADFVPPRFAPFCGSVARP